MHVEPRDRWQLGQHQLEARVAPSDEAAPLRILSLLTRRGVLVSRIVFVAAPPRQTSEAAPQAAFEASGRITIEFRATAEHAQVVAAGVRAMVATHDVRLRAGPNRTASDDSLLGQTS